MTYGAELLFSHILDEARIQQDVDVAEKLLGLLSERQLSLATAESVTGGGVAQRICEVPGASAVYVGGAVSYSLRLKLQWCGVLPKTIQMHGEVSAATALEMATGVRSVCHSQVGLSTTGFSGPSVLGTQLPVGTVFVGLDIGGKTWVNHFLFAGDRREIQMQATQAALVFCYAQLCHV